MDINDHKYTLVAWKKRLKKEEYIRNSNACYLDSWPHSPFMDFCGCGSCVRIFLISFCCCSGLYSDSESKLGSNECIEGQLFFFYLSDESELQ